MNDSQPADAILLFGLPRSGTTWLGKIYDSHPLTLYRHEPDSCQRMTSVPLLPDIADTPRYAADIVHYLRAVPAIRTTKVCAKMPLFRKAYLSETRFRALQAAAVTAKLASRYWSQFPVLGAPTDRVSPQPRLVWKSIESLGRLGVMARSLESICGIHILRHPCGYVASVLRGEAAGSFVAAGGVAEDYEVFGMLAQTEQARRRRLTLDDFRALTPVERLAWRWLLFNEKALEELRDDRRFRVLRYEDLCAQPVAVARDLFAFSGLTWDGQNEAFLGASTTNPTDAYYGVFKDPLQAANKWRQELPAAEQERILAVVRDSEPGRLFAAPEAVGP